MARQSVFFTFLHLVAVTTVHFKEASALQTLHIGAFFPFNVTNAREETMKADLILPMVNMAIKDIESKDILPGYRLQLYVNDTQCRTDHASRALFELIHKEPTKIALLGAGCSAVSERIAEEAKIWNLVMVSYGSTSTTLLKKEKYPLFFRTIPSDAACNKGLIALLKRFNWRQVGLIGKTDITHSETTAHLREELERENIKILTSETFADDPTAQVQSLKEKDVRIIMGNFDERSARKVFCQAYHFGLYGSRYVWIIPGWYQTNWWKSELTKDSLGCTESEMNEAVTGYIACDNVKISPGNDITVTGQTPQELKSRYQLMGGLCNNGTMGQWNNATMQQCNNGRSLQSTDAGFAYDAVLAIAIALNRTLEHFKVLNTSLSINNFKYLDNQMLEHFKTAIGQTNFKGVTGPVEFTHNGDRIGFIKIEQLQGKKPPSDQAKLILQLMTISPVLYGVMCSITILCIILAVCFLAFNIKLRHYRYIQMSSPRLNDTIIAGSITMYLSVFLFGLDGNLLSSSQYSITCQARIWLASVGFTTSFGAMFAKIWRVYVIFTNAKLRKKVIEDGRLFLFVGVLLLVDIFTLSLWTGLDSQTRTIQNGTVERGTEFDTMRQWEYCDCRHKIVWFGVLFATKVLLLLFGVFLAWETRHVKIPALNDSRYVGLSVYNVVILSVVGVPATLLIERAQNVTFAITAAVILFCITGTLCLVFVPKFIAVKRDPSVLYTSGATSTAGSQAESSTSHDKGMKGAKFIALAAENSSLKSLIAEKEEQIAQLEVRLRQAGVPVECIRRISLAMASKLAQDSKQGFSPTLNTRGDRDPGGSIHIDLTDDGGLYTARRKSTDKQPLPSLPKHQHSPSQSFIDQSTLVENDLGKSRTPIAKQKSLPLRTQKELRPVQTRARTCSIDNEHEEAHVNPGISMETSDGTRRSPKTKQSKVNRMESPFYKEYPKGHLSSHAPSVKARYGKPKREMSAKAVEKADSNANRFPTIKDGELNRKGSIVLVSKSRTGETCFQVKTPANLERRGSSEEIRV
ncbi:gamma-aminobutyric acid type B receptor subunit 2-like isoform X2 [Montipora foliosa]|uniref:gamma-aminobutyric acid type B receptor subunit 2-like isoform X2 n=1 Tax=Montipora foliosa TaxID=591990 RepID=UPI0035F1B933